MVISESKNGEATSYTYGLERISAITGNTRTEYVYDGRGSVAAEVSYNTAWYTFGGGLARKNVVSKSYSPFGELLTEQTSGFGYNGEYYNAATGMIYLRARFYEPEMNRFSQKDLLRGSAFAPQSLNRYVYVQNDPMNLIDPSGMSIRDWGKKVVNGVKNAWNTVTTGARELVDIGKTMYYGLTGKPDPRKPANQPVDAISGASSSASASASSASTSMLSTLSSGSFSASDSTSSYNQNGARNNSPTISAPSVQNVTGSGQYSCGKGIFNGSTNPLMLLNMWNPWGSLLYPGEIHDAVTKHFSRTRGFDREVWFLNEGKSYRLDLYSPKANAYWEVKPVSYIAVDTIRSKKMDLQMNNYDKFASRGVPLGTESFPYKDYTIYTYSFSPGIIYYKFKKNEHEDPAPVVVPEPERQRDTSSRYEMASGALIIAGCVIIIGTIIEDVASGGIGIADDPLTIGAGGAMVSSGLNELLAMLESSANNLAPVLP